MTLQDGVGRLGACLLELHALPLDHTFLDGLLRVVRWLIPSEHAVYGLTDPGMKMALLWIAHPAPIDDVRWLPVFDAHFGDHPLHGAAEGHAPSGQVVCTRELGGEAWPRSGLFREFCQPLAMGHQLLCRLPSATGYVEVVGAARAQAGFLPEERELFEQLSDHVVLAWSKVRRIGEAGGAVCGGDPDRRVQHVQCDSTGRLLLATEGSQRLLARYFAVPADARVPCEIMRWIDHQLALAPCGQTDPRAFQRRLTVPREGQMLEIWLASAAGRTTHDLYLRERSLSSHPAPAGRSRRDPSAALPQAAASRWALTPRQTKVLEGVLRGATNKEIARDLGLAEVTIEYHLTTLFRRLQAPGRAALIARCYNDAHPPMS